MSEINCPETKNIGLRGIVVADSNICKVDGDNGKLAYRGYDVLTLAENSTFEEVVYLLLYNQLPNEEQLISLRADLTEYRNLSEDVIRTLRTYSKTANPMDVLQATVPVLASYDPDVQEDSKESHIRSALRLIARIPLVLTAFDRIRKGLSPVAPDPNLSHAANLLLTLNDVVPDERTARDMDLALILHAEHSFNASTFTARQIASSRAHLYASISGAAGSLSGELHGGANERVFRMLETIGSADKAENYVLSTLAKGGKIMGMGHAVYKVVDPRALILEPMAKRLSEATGNMTWYDISEKVKEIAVAEFEKNKGGKIYPNVDFYSATVYRLMGFEADLFTPLFAISRISGWAAHVIEEKFAEAQPKPALYRPKAEYSGRYCGPEGCTWIPREERN